MQQKVLTEKGHKRQILKVNNHLCSVQHFLVSFLPFEERGSYSSYNCLKLYFNVCKRGSGHALPCSVCQDICNVCCTFVVFGRLCCDIHLSKSRICSKDVLLQHSSTCHTQLQLPLQKNWLSVTSCLILSSFLTFLIQKELPRALWCPVASSSTSMMTARHTQCTWRVCECVGPSCFFHAERFECSKHTLGGCCCCCTKCLRVQLQVVLVETTENVHDTMQQHSSLHTGPVSMEAMQDCDEQHCRLHSLCLAAQLVCSHDLDVVKYSCKL